MDINNQNNTLLRSILYFILAGTVWIFGIEHFLFEEKFHLYEKNHTLSLELLYNHLPNFLFILFAACFLYLIINKSYQNLYSMNKQLRERETDILVNQLEIETLYERERHLRSVMSMVRDINAYLITAKNIDELGKMCCNRLAHFSDYKLVWIGLIEEEKIVVKYHSTDMSQYLDFNTLPLPDKLKKTNCPICKAINEDQTIIINDVTNPTLPEKLRAAADDGIDSLVSLPLKSRIGGEVFGVLNIYSIHKDGFTMEEVAMLEELSGDIGFAIHTFEEENEHKRLDAEKVRNSEQMLFSLIELIENRDSYTAGHTQRVATYCTMIAEAMGYGSEEIQKLHKAAMLHDIGKIQTPDAILLKPGKLDPYEHELIQEHVSVGYRMLHKIDMYRELAEIMRHHHEHYDGSGYPEGLRGDEIPLLSHIMIVADAFDAMTTSRIYKPRMNIDDALSELQQCALSQFHPDVVAAALQVLPEIQLNTAHQLPINRIENERLSYFYKDRLTGTFNYNYLQTVLNNPDIFGKYRYLCSIALKNFTQLNKEFGWAYGDKVLESFGNYLNTSFKDSLQFRQHGDDFLIFSQIPIACNRRILQEDSPLSETMLEVEILILDLEEENIYDIDAIESSLAAHTISK